MIQRIVLNALLPVLCCMILTACNEPEAYNGSSSFQSTPTTKTTSHSNAISTEVSAPTANHTAVKPSSADLKEAGNYWKREGKKVDITKTKRVLIAEFGVVFVTSRDHKIGNNSLSLGTMMRIAGVGRREYKFDDSFKAEYPTQLYNQYVKHLESQGYEVISLEDTLACKALEDIEKGKAGSKKSGNYYHGFFGGKGSQKAEIYPAAGMDQMGAGFLGLGESKNMKAVNAAMGELKADMAIRVLIGVGLFKGQACLEPGSSIRAFSNLKSSKMPNGTMNYWPQSYTTLTSKKTLFYDKPVVDQTEFKAFKGKVWNVNEAQFASAINQVFPKFATQGIMKLAY
ncbi:MAG TPA: hypothetical protein DCM28_20075 [Phycisphaerales bacterium]|nr:hypothetical protein [Phycisphaerales bacterium]HCD33692.1 hypothetical protein [Phycisphaerales bacterium]|tara:strand:+ start:124 stop:1149 length:1026 start_codon:yes stop_codon:yes gene_type:complete